MRKGKKIAALLLAVVLLLTACAQEEAPQEDEQSASLRAYVCAEPATLDPIQGGDAGTESLLAALYEGLMRLRSDGSGKAVAVEGMAKEYSVKNNYDNTVTYTFTLRSSARWSDGRKVSADDFVYAWRRLADPALDSPCRTLLSIVSGYDTVQRTGDVTALGVEALNSSTFAVRLTAPCIYFLDTICTCPATAPLRADLMTGEDGQSAAFGTVTNGPFVLSDWAEGERLTVSRNAEYYESRLVTLESIDFVFAADPDEAYARWESGEIDYLGQISDRVMEERSAQGEELTLHPLAVTCCVLYSHLHDVFSNVEARQAFDMSLDRAEIAAAAGVGAEPAIGLVPYGIGSDPAASQDFRSAGGDLFASYPQEIADRRAAVRGLLMELGQSIDRFSCIYVDGSFAPQTVSALVSGWKRELNVEIEPQALTQEEYDARLRSGEFDLALYELTGRYDDPMSYLSFLNSEEDGSLTGYCNVTYDLLLGVARSATDAAARAAFLHDAEAMVLEECALSPLYFETTAVCTDGWNGIYWDNMGRSYFTSAVPEG